MPPTATTRSEWAGFHKLCSISQTITNSERHLYERENPQVSQGPSPIESPPFTNTLLPPPNQSSGPGPGPGQVHIVGLSRTIFIVVIVIGVVVLTVTAFVSVCCYKRWKRNRPVKEHTLSVQMQDIEHTSHFGDPPRPDSTTLPTKNATQRKSDGTLPLADGNIAGPLETILNKFSSPSGSASHRRLGSSNSTYSSSSRATWDNEHITRVVSNAMPSSLSEPTSNNYQGVAVSPHPPTPGPFSPVPFSAYRSPSIASLESTSPRVSSSTRAKRPFRETIMSVPRPLLIPKRLRKKARPIAVEKTFSEPSLGPPVAAFAGFGRASTGSMNNWVSWWESSSEEGEGEEVTSKKKKRKK